MRENWPQNRRQYNTLPYVRSLSLTTGGVRPLAIGWYDGRPLMQASPRRSVRWIVGSLACIAAATVLFDASGQSSPPSAPITPNAYRAVATDDRDVRTALNFALGDQRKKNRSNGAITLLGVLSAERQASKGDNFRLCLSLDRRGRTDTARTVVHRNQKHQWSVALWAWGACGKT